VGALKRIYNGVIVGLAISAGAMMAAVFLMIVLDVVMRTSGLQPPLFVSALSEYSLLYMTMFAAPWVVRIKGHVYVESLTSNLSARVRLVIERGVLILCICVCLVLAYYAATTGIEIAGRGEDDVRSIVIPRWVLFVPLPVGFTLCAAEFFRFLLGYDRMLSGKRTASVDVG